MKDNFDLKKFLTESKTFENFNPYTSKKEPLNENALRERIREMILSELGDEDPELEARKQKYGINPEMEEEDYSDYFFDIDTPEDEPDPEDLYGDVTVSYGEREPYKGLFKEAKKKKEEAPEEEVDVEATAEEIPAEEVSAEETPAASGGLEDVVADMEGTEGELMDHLMSAFKIAKGMNNEKLETQVGNTLKFFVSEYIGGGEG
jgi:hypothetical protein